MKPDRRGLAEAFIGDGRSLIILCGIFLGLAGLFAIFQSMTGHFLPHDVEYLQMQPQELCGINECRIVHFMIHDRISFGGSLVAIAVLYMWLAEFPLRHGEPWAWWTLVASGVAGFGSFLTYLGYGYLDTWHGAATLVLLPCFVWGLWLQRPSLRVWPRGLQWLSVLRPAKPVDWRSLAGLGRILMLVAACGMIGAGLTIQFLGMTSVFVPSDLEFMGIPHIAEGQTPLTQTRLFRGTVYRFVAFDHLYHLEHHLYPAVPHHHWRRLAVRLDPYFAQLGVRPVSLISPTFAPGAEMASHRPDSR